MHIEFEYVAIFVIAMAVFLISTFWEPRKYRRRRKSLHQDASGVWIWTELDGSEMRSDIHPGEPGAPGSTTAAAMADLMVVTAAAVVAATRLRTH